MKHPKVSVLLGVLNQESYLPACIESVLAQTFSDFEFIILNDGSSDRTWEIIQDYAKKDSRIRPYSFPEKQGIAVGCNFTVAKAEGEYLARMDGDDIWNPEKLERQVQYLEQHPECGVCFSQAEIIDGDGKVVQGADCDFMDQLFAQPNRDQSQWLQHLFCCGNCLLHSSSVIRSSSLKQVAGYRNAFRQLPDFDLWMQLIQVSEFYVFPEKLLRYRWYTQNTSIPNSIGASRTYQEYFQLYLQLFQTMDAALFCRAFSSLFRCQDSSTPQELACEQAFLLLEHSAGELPEAGKLAGLTLLTDLINHEDTRKLLEEKYHFTTFDYIALESDPIFYSTPLHYPDAKLVPNQLFAREATLYYNTEAELTQEKILTQSYSATGKLIHFTFSLPEKDIQILRFDPLEGHPCMVWFFYAQLNGQPLHGEPIGATLEGGWSFPGDDPQIMLPLPQPVSGTVTITLGIAPLDQTEANLNQENQVSVSRVKYLNMQNALKDAFQQEKQTLENKQAALVQQLEDTSLQLQAATADRDSLRAQLNRIYQTKAYRAYAKVRRLFKNK